MRMLKEPKSMRGKVSAVFDTTRPRKEAAGRSMNINGVAIHEGWKATRNSALEERHPDRRGQNTSQSFIPVLYKAELVNYELVHLSKGTCRQSIEDVAWFFSADHSNM